jgi:hypothetical protein
MPPVERRSGAGVAAPRKWPNGERGWRCARTNASRRAAHQSLPKAVSRRPISCSIANLSCRLIEGGQQFEYRMTIKSQDRRNAEKLSVYLRSLPEVVEFRIAPTGD